MIRILATCFIVATVLLFNIGEAFAGWGWVVYHERSFKGRVIDAETKEPIEGAVVVAKYNARYIGPTGGHDTLIDVQEALTDKDGNFHMPSLTTLIYPLAWGTGTTFLLWKPGYKAAEKNDWFFKEEPGTVVTRPVFTEKGLEPKPVRVGIVELERAKTREEREKALPHPITIDSSSEYKKQRQFISLINEERIYFGFQPYKRED